MATRLHPAKNKGGATVTEQNASAQNFFGSEIGLLIDHSHFCNKMKEQGANHADHREQGHTLELHIADLNGYTADWRSRQGAASRRRPPINGVGIDWIMADSVPTKARTIESTTVPSTTQTKHTGEPHPEKNGSPRGAEHTKKARFCHELNGGGFVKS